MKTTLRTLLFLCCSLIMALFTGCGGGGGSSSPSTPTTTTSTTGTINGTVTLPANTNAKLFDVKLPLYARLFTTPAYAAAITDLTKLTVKIGSATTNPSASGTYTLTVTAGSNLDLTVTAPSGNVVLEAIIPSVTAGSSASQNVDSTSTAVALIYKENTKLTISQISSSSAVTNVKNAVETALTDSTVDSIVSNTTVTSAATTAATTVASGTTAPSAPTGVSATAGNGQVTISWTAVTGATSYNLYMASQSGVTKSNYSSKTGGMAHTGVTSPYAHTGLTNGTKYYFVVTLVNSAGEGSESSEISSTPKAAEKIDAGSSHTCSLLSDNTIKCWGYNSAGQLGNGTTTSSSTPVSVSGITTAKSLTVGATHACALLSDNTIKCWGSSGSGELGSGSTGPEQCRNFFPCSTTPVSVSGITNAVTISAGEGYTCALLSDGTMKCWGWNGYGQLGNGTTVDSTVPTLVSGITTAKNLSSGYVNTCALLSDSTVQCWGDTEFGGIGNGTTTGPDACSQSFGGKFNCRLTPISVSGINNAQDIVVADYGGFHICVILSGGSVKCWGANGIGQLGYSGGNSTTPVSISDIANAKSISAGALHTCALISDGSLKCWGDNSYGQLGNGTTTSSLTPVTVSNTLYAELPFLKHSFFVFADFVKNSFVGRLWN